MYYSKNLILRRRKQFYIGAVAVIGLVAVIFFVFSPFESDSDMAPVELKAAEVPIEFEYERKEWVPELPVRLVIPAIDVDAEVQYVGLDPEGTGEMDVPSNFTDVGWYKDGVRPGMRGSAVMTGHYNTKDSSRAVFYDLDKLEIGDEVVIMSEERIEDIFQVVKIVVYDYDAPTTEVFLSTDGKKRLNLITCSGEWLSEEKLYNKRTVVFTELLTDVE